MVGFISSKAPAAPFMAELEDRLGTVDDQIALQEKGLALLQEERQLLVRLLEIERSRMPAFKIPKAPPSLFEPTKIGIPEIINSALSEGPKTKGVLLDRAIRAGHHQPARAIHATLMNFMRAGYVAATDDGEYDLTKTGKKALSTNAEGHE